MAELPATAVAETLAQRIAASRGRALPAAVVERAEEMLIDIAGLCVAARASDYVRAAIDGWEADGGATVIGHRRRLDAAGAAFVNGTAAHGEDFDDTFEGGPVHAGVVMVPAILAAAERHRIGGADSLFGLAVGVETMCRLSLVAPKLFHKAGFHPTAVLGAMGAAAGVATALRLPAAQLVDALGVAGSLASGIIEYLAEGTWTKRLHPGWAAQSGLRAVDLARHGFKGPRTVFEGTHGLLHGFANTANGDWDALLGDFGTRWVAETIAFKPYACGTMTHPYVDCAKRLAARGIRPEDVASIVCEVGEGTVHRLWEPLAAKQRPPNAYAAKFSQPYCIAAGFVLGDAGLDAFTEARVNDARLVALAGKVRYVVDPGNPYPREYTGHVRATLTDGRVVEERQPHLRGGAHEKLPRAEIEAKFLRNAAHGGWAPSLAGRFLDLARGAFARDTIDLAPFRA
ncbi:MAG: MmgE/PrpD family protein [Alphaproteobacteria bacterium]|nr:MmgE/PrpD family protein [Alphaproteobacteria bacterium]